MTKAKTVGTVREKERELHFSNRKCGSVQQPDTHTDIFKKINKGRNTFICDIKMTDYN